MGFTVRWGREWGMIVRTNDPQLGDTIYRYMYVCSKLVRIYLHKSFGGDSQSLLPARFLLDDTCQSYVTSTSPGRERAIEKLHTFSSCQMRRSFMAVGSRGDTCPVPV